MLKRKLLIASLATLSALCVSCGSDSKKSYENDSRFMPQREESASLIELNYSEVEAKIIKKESFILYIKQAGCMSCKAFAPILESWINETKINVYSIERARIPNDSKLHFRFTPTVQIFKDGEMIDSQDPVNTKTKMFNNITELKKYFNKYVIENNQLFISDATLDSMIENKETFLIYFSWKSCGDCQMMNKMFLDEYLYDTKDKNQTLYVIEVDPWRSQKTDNPEVWENFTSKYHLSKVSDDEFGYRTGVVPTIQYYVNGELNDAVVYFNDVLTVDTNEVGDITGYRIDFETQDGVYSYYPEEIYELYKDTVFTDYQNYKDVTNKFYSEKLLELFKKCYG